MAVEGKVVEVKRGEPVPAHVAVGDVVVVQPDHGGPKFGMPHAEVTVSSLSSEWPFPMCCSCVLPDRCTLDQGLCCYACWCSVCAHAEVAEQNGIRGLCRQKEWYKQCGIIVGVYLLAGWFCMPCFAMLWAPCIMTAYGTQVRDGVKRKCGACPTTSAADRPAPRTSPATSASCPACRSYSRIRTSARRTRCSTL